MGIGEARLALVWNGRILCGNAAKLVAFPHNSISRMTYPCESLLLDKGVKKSTCRYPVCRRSRIGDGLALLGYVLFNQQRWKESMAEYVEAAKYRDLTASELKTFRLCPVEAFLRCR